MQRLKVQDFSKKLNEVFHSFKVIPQAVAYIVYRPKLYHLILIPLFINIILGLIAFGLIFASFLFFTEIIIDALDTAQWLSGVVNWIGGIVGVVIAFFVSWFIVASIGAVIQSPFNGRIVEIILEENGMRNRMKMEGGKQIWFDIVRALKFELTKLAIIFGVFILTFFLNFIPIIGSIFYVLINTANVFFLNLLDLLDPSYERFQIGTKEEIRSTYKNITSYSGIGLFAYAVWNIPIINFVFMPFLYTAATLAFIETYEHKQVKG